MSAVNRVKKLLERTRHQGEGIWRPGDVKTIAEAVVEIGDGVGIQLEELERLRAERRGAMDAMKPSEKDISEGKDENA